MFDAFDWYAIYKLYWLTVTVGIGKYHQNDSDIYIL